jgi:hypothetical protein
MLVLPSSGTPPTLGLSVPSQSNATTDIAPNQWIAADNGSTNCTAILSGTDAFPLPDLWVVGQREFSKL